MNSGNDLLPLVLSEVGKRLDDKRGVGGKESAGSGVTGERQGPGFEVRGGDLNGVAVAVGFAGDLAKKEVFVFHFSENEGWTPFGLA